MADTSNVNTNTALGNVGRQMESILNNLGLGVQSESFARERMEPETVLSASDADLEKLGVWHHRPTNPYSRVVLERNGTTTVGYSCCLSATGTVFTFYPVDLCIWWPWGVHAMPEVGGELVLQDERDNHGRHSSSAWRIGSPPRYPQTLKSRYWWKLD